MPQRSSKSQDHQQIARRILDTVTPDAEPPKIAAKAKDPAIVSLLQAWDLKGGPGRRETVEATSQRDG